jgi:hypothetical protein
LVTCFPDGKKKFSAPFDSGWVGASEDMVSVFLWMGAGGAFLGAICLPFANEVVCWKNIVNKLCQVNSAMKVTVDGAFVCSPVDVGHGGVGPVVPLLNVL